MKLPAKILFTLVAVLTNFFLMRWLEKDGTLYDLTNEILIHLIYLPLFFILLLNKIHEPILKSNRTAAIFWLINLAIISIIMINTRGQWKINTFRFAESVDYYPMIRLDIKILLSIQIFFMFLLLSKEIRKTNPDNIQHKIKINYLNMSGVLFAFMIYWGILLSPAPKLGKYEGEGDGIMYIEKYITKEGCETYILYKFWFLKGKKVVPEICN